MGSVSVRVQKEDVCLHPGPEFWTQLIASSNNSITQKILTFLQT